MIYMVIGEKGEYVKRQKKKHGSYHPNFIPEITTGNAWNVFSWTSYIHTPIPQFFEKDEFVSYLLLFLPFAQLFLCSSIRKSFSCQQGNTCIFSFCSVDAVS